MALINDDFVIEAQMIAKSRGMLLKYVTFPRTINTMPVEEIEAETDRACKEIVKLLSQSA